MAAKDIQAKVISGLAKAKSKAGSTNSPLTTIIKTTISSVGSPLNPPHIEEVEYTLLNAVINPVKLSTVNGLIQQGDMKLTCDSNIPVELGDIVCRGGNRYAVTSVEPVEPFGEVILYKANLRSQ